MRQASAENFLFRGLSHSTHNFKKEKGNAMQ